jgi:NAD(P)-dependent dehydrogenase (short-subunit alcohol dehydrogenase family)
MTEKRLAGEIAVVTGAAGALGAAVARRLSEEGATVVLFGRRAAELETLAACLPGRALIKTADLFDRAAVAAAIAEVTAEIGAPTVACAIAGGFDMGPAVHETPGDLWQKMLDLNVGTLLSLMAAVTPGMVAAGHGSIVTVGAMPALKATAGMGAYAASKSAVLRLTESAAAELKDKGVRVNAVLPSIIDTPANRADMPKADPAKWVSTGELAAVIAFLASRQASGVTGALIPVTGRV